jgi:hypothetical protein
LAPVECIILNKLVSPIICVGQFNHQNQLGKGLTLFPFHKPYGLMKQPNPLGLKYDTITSPRRLVNTFIHQIVPDLLKRDKPKKVAINFKSWSTTRDISSEWG